MNWHTIQQIEHIPELLIPLTLTISSFIGTLSYTINLKHPVITHPLSLAVNSFRRSIKCNKNTPKNWPDYCIGSSYEPPTKPYWSIAVQFSSGSMISRGEVPTYHWVKLKWKCMKMNEIGPRVPLGSATRVGSCSTTHPWPQTTRVSSWSRHMRWMCS